MIIYTAGSCIAEEAVYRLTKNRLLTYAQRSTKVWGFWLNPEVQPKRLFVDSGAYTAWTQGARIDLDEYCAFLKRNAQQISVYAVLDVIGDYQGTAANQVRMEASGLSPLPVFHKGSPFTELERICERYSYFAIGGLVRARDRFCFLDQCFTIIKKKWPIKVHAFGAAGQGTLERYPFYSCDSSSAFIGGSMGQTSTWDGRKIVSEYKRADLMIARRSREQFAKRMLHNIENSVYLQNYITDLWARRGIRWDEPETKGATL